MSPLLALALGGATFLSPFPARAADYTVCRWEKLPAPDHHIVLTEGANCGPGPTGTTVCVAATFTNRVTSLATNICRTATLSITSTCLCDGKFIVEWTTLDRVSYTLQQTTDLTNWLPVITLIGQTNRLSWLDPLDGASSRFYRVKVNLP